MTFKIPGLKAAALGSYKSQCEEWVEALMAGDKPKCDQILKAIESQPDSKERNEAIAYIRKKMKVGVKTKKPVVPPPEQEKKTPLHTMRLAVNLLTISRRPFAEAILESIRAEKMTEAVLTEIKAVCDASITALRRQNEFRDLYRIPETIK